MNNDSFQEKIDGCFEKFKERLRVSSPMLTGAVFAGVTAFGLAALSAYDLASMAEFTDFSQITSVFEFTKNVFALVGKESLGLGYMAYKTVNIPKNIVICSDQEEGRKPEPEPVTDGFLGVNKLGRAIEKKINYGEWDNKVFLGWLKDKAEEFKDVVRDTTLNDTLVLSGCALAAATVFNAFVLNNAAAPLTDALGHCVSPSYKFAEIFNNNLLLAVTSFTVFTGIKAKIIKSDSEKALMKEFNVSHLGLGKETDPVTQIIQIADSLKGLDAANKKFLRSRENLVSALRDLRLVKDGSEATKSEVLKSVQTLDGLYAESIKNLERLVGGAQELKELDPLSYDALVSDKQAKAIEQFQAIKDDDLRFDAQVSNNASAKNPLDAFYGSKGYENMGNREDVNLKKAHVPHL